MNFLFPAPGAVSLHTRALGNHMRPLLTMAARRQGLLALQDQDRTPFTVPEPRPWVVIIGDDPPTPASSLGPLGFDRDSVAALLRAASEVTLIAGDIISAKYSQAAEFGARGLSTVIIETRPEHQWAWIHFAQLVAPRKLGFVGLAAPARRA
ncbi:hypothetical protein [Methylorubrum extorquens]|uniref:Uncharacterized protein n=1 Tax=Methylorubrum extorquens TaxID=408 RepID=A0AAX3WB09_METEX|nr:hypothetical protein [Methylorubrum extorquens]WHQ68625.1 hypothetical protein KEC54_19965 [Methylorubrum extorquens]